MAKMHTGSTPLFEDMVLEHGKAIFNYIYRLVSHRELAEDLYQEVLLSAYLAFPSVKEKTKIKNWLFTIAANKCRDYWRKENRTKQFWRDEVYSYTFEMVPSPVPEDEVLHKNTAEEVAETVLSLPEIYQFPIFLYYYRDFTLNEIASKSNLPISTVKTRIKRAKERLRPKMQSLA